ncbi:homoserine kinase, partial [Fusobacterium mortiferum]|nr:homoserine kinase [Fusobacterium mortiferum]
EYHISLFLKEYEKYRKLELGEKRALEIAIKKVNLTFILLRLDKFINENLSGVLIENKSYSELLTLLD